MPRTVVLGTSGAGKTTVARALAQRQGATLVELDELATGPGWSTTPDEELRSRVLAALSASDWVVDGNYERALGDLVLERAELAIWLDLPLRVSVTRMIRRTRALVAEQSELWHGNRERWRWRHLTWLIWEVRSHLRRRLKLPRRLARHRDLRVVRLRSQAAVDAWLEATPPRPCLPSARSG